MTKSNDSANEKRKTSLYVPEKEAEIVKDNPEKDFSESMRRGLRAEAYGEEVVAAEEKNDVERELREQTLSAIDDTLARFRDDGGAFMLEEIEDEIESLRNTVETNVERRIQERQEAAEETPVRGNERLEEHLEELESHLQDGYPVFPNHGVVEDAANVSGASSEEIIQTLKKRNPEYPDCAFTSNSQGNQEWRGQEYENLDSIQSGDNRHSNGQGMRQ